MHTLQTMASREHPDCVGVALTVVNVVFPRKSPSDREQWSYRCSDKSHQVIEVSPDELRELSVHRLSLMCNLIVCLHHLGGKLSCWITALHIGRNPSQGAVSIESAYRISHHVLIDLATLADVHHTVHDFSQIQVV